MGTMRDALVKTYLVMMIVGWMWKVKKGKELKLVSGLSSTVGMLQRNKSKVERAGCSEYFFKYYREFEVNV